MNKITEILKNKGFIVSDNPELFFGDGTFVSDFQNRPVERIEIERALIDFGERDFDYVIYQSDGGYVVEQLPAI